MTEIVVKIGTWFLDAYVFSVFLTKLFNRLDHLKTLIYLHTH